MGRVFCVANQKGGVGKTTTAVSLADGFAKSSAKTLLIDFDPQRNATSGLDLKPLETSPFLPAGGTASPLADVIVQTPTPNLDVLPGSRDTAQVDGSRDTAQVEALLRTRQDEAAQMLERLLQTITQYDYVLFDCPPSLGHLTQLALFASTDILIPVQCEYFAMEGLVQMIEVFGTVMEQKPELKFGGFLLTMHDISLEFTHAVEANVRDFCGEVVFQTVIPRDATISEAQSHGKSIIDYAPRSRGARAYVELCREIFD